MKTHHENIKTQEIEKLETCYNNFETILYRLKQKIGLSDGILAPTVFAEEPELDLQAPYDMQSVVHGTNRQLVNINGKPYLQDHTIGIDGLNRHLENPLLYISLSPINKHFVWGKSFISRALEKISRQNEGLAPTLLLLGGVTYSGGKSKLEVFEAYKKYETAKKEDIGGGGKFVLGKGIFGDEEIDAYYLIANETSFALNSIVLEWIYFIYNQTIACGKPLLIQCQDGLERSSKFAFAFEVLRKFKTIFESSNLMTITDNLYETFDMLRRSRSPVALSLVDNLEQGLALAFGLKLVELNMHCIGDIDHFIETHKGEATKVNDKLNSRIQKLKEFAEEFSDKECERGQQKATISKFLLTPELSSHYNLTFLPNRLRAEPEYTTLLKNLYYVVNLQSKIEHSIFMRCALKAGQPSTENTLS